MAARGVSGVRGVHDDKGRVQHFPQYFSRVIICPAAPVVPAVKEAALGLDEGVRVLRHRVGDLPAAQRHLE